MMTITILVGTLLILEMAGRHIIIQKTKKKKSRD